MKDRNQFDVQLQILRLIIYPIKSCAGVEVDQAVIQAEGLQHDREWMLADERGEFLTQRELPEMVLVRPEIRDGQLWVQAPRMTPMRVPSDTGHQVTVSIWGENMLAHDCGDVAAQWFSQFLGQPVRLVRFHPSNKRLSDSSWTGSHASPNRFTDGYPLLLLSEASMADLNQRLRSAGHGEVSMDRFRPNLVLGGVQAQDEDRLGSITIHTGEGAATIKGVRPCKRCPIPNIDPATAHSSFEVMDMLQSFRQNPSVGGAVTFGVNGIVLSGNGLTLRVGQAAQADYLFD